MRVLLLLAPLLLVDLQPGRHAVGLRVSEQTDPSRSRAMQVTVWYPARRGGTAMRFRDVLALDSTNAGYESFLQSTGIPTPAVKKWLDAKLLSKRNAPPADGRFPLVLIAQGNRHTAADQAILAEYIASHGYVVATVPSAMNISGPMKSESEIGAKAEEQALDLEFLADVMRNDASADAAKIAVIGHSFGARAGLLYAMRNPAVAALVSLDGGIGVAAGREQLERSTFFRKEALRAHVAHLYEENDEFMKPDLAMLNEVAKNVYTRKLTSMHHAHFSSAGFAAASLPDVARITRAGAGIRDD
ncbi:MAG TPA: hypothetical protein VF698_13745, partial [Thermoanaerobaculia bacterium]